MDIHDVALALFTNSLQKPTGINGPLTPAQIQGYAERAYAAAAVFMAEAQKNKAVIGKTAVEPLRI